MNEAPRWIEYRALAEVEGAEVNPKDHEEALIDSSYRRFGSIEAITLDGRTGRLISGHGRLESLRRSEAAGDAPPDGVVVGEAGWMLPVQCGWSSANEAEARAALIAVNRVGEVGGWKPLELYEELMGFESLDGVGYDVADLDVMGSALAQPAFGVTDPDAEWEGMPAFDQENLRGKYITVIHFVTFEDAERFWLEVFGEDKIHRSAWWPKHDGHVGMDSRNTYMADGELENDGADAEVPDLHPIEEPSEDGADSQVS